MVLCLSGLEECTIERPSFVELFKAYLAAFNEKNLEKVFAFISPSLSVYVNGRLKGQGRDNFAGDYTSHWARLTQPVYYLEEPKELEDADGVEVTLVDHPNAADVKYFYVYEDGKWLHIRHEITTRGPLEAKPAANE